ncbi:hypothetical protein BDV18DRAFT_164216 [Aspergillus unguis]
MDLGYSIVDLIQGAHAVWLIYQSFAPGPRSAKSEFSVFCDEFSFVHNALQRLQSVTANIPGEDLDLGKGYEQTLARCDAFISKHKALGQDAQARRASLSGRLVSVWDRVSWPVEREEAESLRRYLERYVQIAILKLTANTRDEARKIARESEAARIEHHEILKTVRSMSVQVSSILRRCMPDGSDDPTLDVKYLARLQRKHLNLLDPFSSLNTVPENDILSQSDSQATLQRVQDIADRLGYLLRRLDNFGRQPTPSPERPSPMKRVRTSETLGSDTTIAPVVDLFNHIGDEIREALDKVGYDHAVVPGQQPPFYGTNVLNNVAEDWDQFRDWLQFQIVHQPPGPVPAPSIESQTQSPAAKEPSRRASHDSNYPRSPSIDSTWERRASIQAALARHPVQLLFPDPNRPKSFVHRALKCQVVVNLNSRTHEPESIESIDVETGTRVHHRPSRSSESTLIPYIQHSGFRSSENTITFKGQHRVKIEHEGSVKTPQEPPVYVCKDREDFDFFQTTLLGRTVVFGADVTRIHSDGMGDHCALETVRVLQDPLTSVKSILYFGSYRRSSHTPGRFIDCPVSDFCTPKISGKNVKLPLISARDSHGKTPRRNSMESSVTTTSQDSRASRGSTGSVFSSASDTRRDKRDKWLQVDFERDRDAQAFVRVLGVS